MTDTATILAGAGCEPDPSTGAIVPAIDLSTTFERAADGSYPHGYVYSRSNNPTRERFEEALAASERGKACVSFGSGMAAISAVFLALEPGAHVLVPDDAYYGIRTVLGQHMVRWGLHWEMVDMTDTRAVRAAIRPSTQLIWTETPSNPMLRITDVAAISEIAREHNLVHVLDGTWAPAPVQYGLDLGPDVVMHSVTKYIGGHSDVLGGALVFKNDDAFYERLRSIQSTMGAVLDPFSSWLALRGMRSMAARLRMQCDTAARLAIFLAGHPAVTRVNYPGLPDHPGHDVATRQMKAYGGMLSFHVAGGADAAMRVAANVAVFTRATSLGGTESLIEHRASVETQPTQTPMDLLRVSVGLESPDDLFIDLSQALDQL